MDSETIAWRLPTPAAPTLETTATWGDPRPHDRDHATHCHETWPANHASSGQAIARRRRLRCHQYQRARTRSAATARSTHGLTTRTRRSKTISVVLVSVAPG